MKISDFARERNVEPQAVSRYISRHPEIQSVCKQENGRIVDLSPEAEALLAEQYPLPKPIEIIQGVPESKYEALQEKYAALLERLTQIQEDRLADQKRVAAGDAAQLLLEAKEESLREVQQRLEAEKARAAVAEEAAKTAEAAAAEAEREVARLRGRSLWARIRNR